MIGMVKKAAVSEVRAWAKQQGFELGDRGRLPAEVWAAWDSGSGEAPQQFMTGTKPLPSVDDSATEVRIIRLEKRVAELSPRLLLIESGDAGVRKVFARTR